MPHTLDTSKLKEVYDTIFEFESRLTAWEVIFVAETHHWWSSGHKLSESQLETLEKIYLKTP